MTGEGTLLKCVPEPEAALQARNRSTPELRHEGHREFKARQNCIVGPCLKESYDSNAMSYLRVLPLAVGALVHRPHHFWKLWLVPA